MLKAAAYYRVSSSKQDDKNQYRKLKRVAGKPYGQGSGTGMNRRRDDFSSHRIDERQDPTAEVCETGLRTRERGRDPSLGVNRLKDLNYNSLLFRAPRASKRPWFQLELNLKRLDLVIAPGADVFSFPHIISGI
jgi:hypothetical protein